jgi:hypothetical protein
MNEIAKNKSERELNFLIKVDLAVISLGLKVKGFFLFTKTK